MSGLRVVPNDITLKTDADNTDEGRKTMKEQLAVSSQQSEEKRGDQVKLPASRKIYVETNGSTVNQNNHRLRIPFREIALSPSKDFDGTMHENAPVRVYDTSGLWTDPTAKCDVRDGLPAMRSDWIVSRGDVEEYEGREILPQDNGYLTKGAEESQSKRTRNARRVSGIETSSAPSKTAHVLRRCTTQAWASSRLRWSSLRSAKISEGSSYDHLTQSERSDRSSLNHHIAAMRWSVDPRICHARICP